MSFFRIDDFARACRLDDDGLAALVEEFHGPRGMCIVYEKSEEQVPMYNEIVGNQEEKVASKFWALLADGYFDNLMRAWTLTTSGHHPESLYSELLVAIAPLPQFARWIREHPDGKEFVLFLINRISRLDTLVGATDDGEYHHMDPAHESATLYCIAFQNLVLLLYTSLCHSNPRSTVQTMTGLNFGAASEASRVLSGIDYVGRFASAIQTHQPLSSSPETAGLWSPPRLQFFRDALGPFFRGERTASFICDARHHNVWWRCSGPSSQSSERFCEVKGDENLHACMQCHSVRYCSKEHQAYDWAHGHKAVCLRPTW